VRSASVPLPPTRKAAAVTDRLNIAHIDLETTGLEERHGSVLEVGLVVTDADLRPLAEWSTLVVPDLAHIAVMPDVVREMHARSGLLDELDALMAARAGGRPHEGLLTRRGTDRALSDVLSPWKVAGRLELGGSGVGHFDGRWLRAHFPRAAQMLTYWPRDVGVLRRELAAVDPELVLEQHIEGEKPHRALADIRLHVAEARAYRVMLLEAAGPLRLARARMGAAALDPTRA
jgi:oligoribonuclease